jgi:hypothetical protein
MLDRATPTDRPGVDRRDDIGLDVYRPTETSRVDLNTLCGTLQVTAKDVYVDKSSTRASVGTSSCPFHTILEATSLSAAASGGRTIHVRGGSPQWVYSEKASLVVRSNTTLLGDGPGKTKLVASGTCVNATGSCAASLEAGAVLEGFTVTSASKGIFIQNSSQQTTVRNTVVASCGLAGIHTEGRAVLGPNIQVNQNGGQGLYIGYKLTEVLSPAGAVNTFDGNTSNGILVNQTGELKFFGGSVANNGYNGIQIGVSGGLSTFLHTISHLVARNNGKSVGHGVKVLSNYSLMMRDSVLLGNKGVGLAFTQSSSNFTNKLDIGADANNPGGNTLSSSDPTKRNGLSGLCLDSSLTAGSQSAYGNKWAACPVNQNAITGNCDGPYAYSEIVYNPRGSGQANPVAAGGCTVAP